MHLCVSVRVSVCLYVCICSRLDDKSAYRGNMTNYVRKRDESMILIQVFDVFFNLTYVVALFLSLYDFLYH